MLFIAYSWSLGLLRFMRRHYPRSQSLSLDDGFGILVDLNDSLGIRVLMKSGSLARR